MARAYHWTKPRITVFVTLRILLVVLLFSLTAFAAGLVAGLLILAVKSAMGQPGSLAVVYRNYGLPAAFLGMFAGLVSMLVLEFRQMRRPRVPRLP
ncbi:MAG: hypothetical protein AB7V46_21975 [Thermomicrobiales bacterium]